ncbi:cytochrome d ubiquinol oxidase subunit II [Carnimonas nigrificans]|uniref:cytochrome d ubiquinol oxidase subunit II n=1 Tax=Carnimonas nigrificans TaxID=64323 RepID=UPI0004AE9AD9|nr:cytochrome d ubiquinol oxidase subunit II [Carnimonas nigrificans]
MFTDMPILPVIWFAVIGFAVAMYIILDGFSLGIGILFPFSKSDSQRDLMMGSVMPVWDGNQTWMILAGAGLYGAFPVVYATILPALYLPLVLMLLALIFRGIAFEFRGKSRKYRHMFDLAFAGGSVVATFAQGVVLGGIVHGLHVSDYQFAGSTFDWLTPFSLFTGIALVFGYASLGAGWLVVKTEGETQNLAYKALRPLTLLLLLAMAIISAWTPLSNSAIAERWFSTPNVYYLSIVPVLVVLLAVNIFFDVTARREKLIFTKLVMLFMLGLIGLVISFFPYVVPPSVTLWDAASGPSSQSFLIVGYAVILPIVLIYTAYSYYVFRGKVKPGNLHHY